MKSLSEIMYVFMDELKDSHNKHNFDARACTYLI